MFGIGLTELLIILALLLLVVGPEKLPEIAKSFGKLAGEFKKSTDELKRTITEEPTVASRSEGGWENGAGSPEKEGEPKDDSDEGEYKS